MSANALHEKRPVDSLANLRRLGLGRLGLGRLGLRRSRSARRRPRLDA